MTGLAVFCSESVAELAGPNCGQHGAAPGLFSQRPPLITLPDKPRVTEHEINLSSWCVSVTFTVLFSLKFSVRPQTLLFTAVFSLGRVPHPSSLQLGTWQPSLCCTVTAF